MLAMKKLKNKPLIRKIFIRKMFISALLQFVVLALLFLVVKNYLIYSNQSTLAEKLIIRGEFSQQELSKYLILDNQYAFNLSLHNISEERRLDSLLFIKVLPEGKEFSNCESIGREGYRLCKNDSGTFYGITPLTVNKEIVGYIVSSKKYGLIEAPIYFALSVILLIVLGNFLFNFLILFVSIKNKVERNTSRLLATISENINMTSVNEIDISEYYQVAEKFLEKKKEIEKLESEKSYISALKSVSDQVAHDIKSPIAAINSVLKDQNTFGEEGRGVIKSAANTLTDIANNLVTGHKSKIGKSKNSCENLSSVSEEPLYYLIDELIHEKEYEYIGKKKSIKFNFEFDRESTGCFCFINHTEVKRSLSNIINNAVEALVENGTVFIRLKAAGENIVISVEDNGSGIPQNILGKVVLENFSYGKEVGSGLGLFYANRLIESYGGTLNISSREGEGTVVTIVLNRSNVPPWHVERIFLKRNAQVVVLDDDKSIHDLWKIRFSQLGNITIYNYYDTGELLKDRCKAIGADLFLIDHHLLDCEHTGLDVIQKLDVAEKSILVTSNFWSSDVQSGCIAGNVKLLPKPCIQNISILSNIERSVVLVDDSQSMRLVWQLSAQNAEVSLDVFKSISDFNKCINKLDKAIEIYIDSDLHDVISGEDYAKDLFELGFLNIYLTTGKQFRTFGYMPWIKRVMGKAPPF